MYVLTLFYRQGSTVKLSHEDDDVLRESAEHSQRQGLLYAWRIVRREDGKCADYWKENENVNQRLYAI